MIWQMSGRVAVTTSVKNISNVLKTDPCSVAPRTILASIGWGTSDAQASGSETKKESV